MQCASGFEITEGDLAFYEKISPVFGGEKILIPAPALCPPCRRQRKLAWRNERTLYQRPCGLCKKEIVSVHAPDHPYPVYCNPCWWSDRWDPLAFGMAYDGTRSFFENYTDLLARVPQRAMVNDDGVMSENSAYTFDVAFSKNCYLCFGMWKAQDCYYCRICDQSKFCVDCEGVKLGSELVYESVDSSRLYRCAFMQNSESCNNCFFGFDLKGCSDCIGCVGLRHKQFYIFNQPYSKEEYAARLARFQLNTRSGLKALQNKFDEFTQKFPRKNMNLQNCENCLGDHLFHCRNVIGYVSTNAEHSKWIERSDGPTIWCYDIIQSGAPELCYEDVTVDNGYMTHFCLYCNQSHYAMYSDNCLHCENIFGCISLRRKKFCILNKQYTETEYHKLAAKIAEDMKQNGTFGEFFPIGLSPYGYNETNASEFFPLPQEDVIRRGWKWRTDLPYTTAQETLPPNRLPDSIQDVADSITKEILACAFCRKNYKIIPQELLFYRNLQVPVSELCPDCRNRKRLARRNPQQLWQRPCMKCGKEMQTTYAPERPEKIYCERCYTEQVY